MMKKMTFLMMVSLLSVVVLGGFAFAQEIIGTPIYQPMDSDSFREASWFIGQRVYENGNQELGQIDSLAFDQTNHRVALVILSDVPGFGSDRVAVPFEMLKTTRAGGLTIAFPAGSDIDQFFSNAKGLTVNLRPYRDAMEPGRVRGTIDSSFVSSVYTHYGLTPYWTGGEARSMQVCTFTPTGGSSESSFSEPSSGQIYTSDKLFYGHAVSRDGGMVGRVDDFVIDSYGRILFVVLSDIPGRENQLVAVPYDYVSFDDKDAFALNISQDQLASAPAFNSVADLRNSGYTSDVCRFYGVQPYWTQPAPKSMTSEPFARESSSAEMMAMAAETPLPSDAKPGECYARIFVPPRFETVSERVVTREASERVETTPATYEVVEEQVMVKSASKRLEEVPAEYKWVDEQVLVEPSHNEWKAGRGLVEKVDQATGEIMCLVEVPARYETVRKQVLVKPATVREVEVPAEYQTIKVTKMTSPPQEKRIPIPEEFQTVTRTEKVSDGHMDWKSVMCETNQGVKSN